MTEHRFRTEEEIENILDNLGSNENRLSFLKSIYFPGNKKVADKIISLSKKNCLGIIESELKYAGNSSDKKRFSQMSKRYIDNYVDSGHPSLILDSLKSWGEEELTDYAVKKISSNEKKESSEYCKASYLETLAKIAEAFGDENLRVNSLERLLNLKGDQKYEKMNALEKLGRYDELLKNYLRNGFGLAAIDLAKKQFPEKTKDIAKKVYSKCDLSQHDLHGAEIFMKSAKESGNFEEAKEKLKEFSKELDFYSDYPRSYTTLVKELVNSGGEKEAKRVVKFVYKEFKKDSYKSYEKFEEVANLHWLVGDLNSVKRIYKGIFENMVFKGYDTREWDKMLKTSRELLQDSKAFAKEEMRILEGFGNYSNAEKVAREIGNEKMAEIYSKMNEMISKK